MKSVIANALNCVQTMQDAIVLYNADGLIQAKNDSVMNWFQVIYDNGITAFSRVTAITGISTEDGTGAQPMQCGALPNPFGYTPPGESEGQVGNIG